MPDVAKLKKRALEFEQKKQFDKALDTYTQVLAELDEHVDEADVALYNRVGDLLLRRGDVAEAVDHYEKAVDLYTDGGFFNNAIALCNKILRNAPGRNSVYYKLGKISARKGFINDAKQNFLEYADRMQKSGQLEEAFRALKEFADLCPDQDDIRLMLADQLVRKDRKSEAIEQLHALYEKFSAEGRSAEARATVDRMKALDPAVEPKEAARPVPTKRDLVFLDVNYDEPKRQISSVPSEGASPPPAKAPTAWTVAPAAPVEMAVVELPMIEMPVVDLPLIEMPGIERVADESSALESSALESPALEMPDLEVSGLEVPGLETTGSDLAPERHSIEMPQIDSDEDILIDLGAPSPSDVEPLPGLLHGGALVTEENGAASDGIVSHVDLGLITGFGDSSSASDDGNSHVAPMAELVSQPHFEPPALIDSGSPENETLAPHEDLQLDEMSSLESSPLDAVGETPGSSDLPMLDVVFDDLDDSPLGGALTFISVDDESEESPLEIQKMSPFGTDFADADASETGGALDPMPESSAMLEVEPAPEVRFESAQASPLAPEPETELEAELMDEPHSPFAGNGAVSTHPGDAASVIEVERSPALDLEARVPEDEQPLQFLDIDDSSTDTIDEAEALSGLPMLDPKYDAAHSAGAPLATEEQGSEPEPAGEPHPETVAASHPAGSDAEVPPLDRVEQLRLEVAHQPAAWDLHRQLAEALLEEGDRVGGIAELEATMFGYEQQGDLANATHSAEELIRVEPNSVRYHQKCVEYAVRANDKAQLVDAYLALAESLFRSGQLDKSRAVYGRVFELSPGDERAASALRELGVQDSGASTDEPLFEADRTIDVPAVAEPHVSRPTPSDARAVPDSEPLPLALEVERTSSPLAIDDELFAALETALPEPPPRAHPVPPARPPMAPAADGSFVNLAEWLREDEPPPSTRMVAAGQTEPEEQQDFADMLTKFKQGVTSNVDETDHESHYDLGIAYREMGLLDEAISEFQKALRGTDQRVRTYEALGQCFVEKRQYQIAMTILLRALNDSDASDDTLVGVLYLLGYASESLQKWEDAVGYYERVFTVDIQFRDVSERLSAVERKAK